MGFLVFFNVDFNEIQIKAHKEFFSETPIYQSTNYTNTTDESSFSTICGLKKRNCFAKNVAFSCALIIPSHNSAHLRVSQPFFQSHVNVTTLNS